MSTPIDQVIDHAAELQQQLDQLAREIMLLTLAGMLLAIAVALIGARLWRAQ